jgi:hypothetical protein
MIFLKNAKYEENIFLENDINGLYVKVEIDIMKSLYLYC